MGRRDEDPHGRRAVITGPNFATIGEDAALLAAVQAAWPSVAAALHPQD